ncbi:type IV secretion system protein [Cysteiniphilum litorale]|uniref:type IV secretion system protein n=1 Tax=Cysteiniphilum litorale TaxID=2056700 RepID=UPI003F883821
MTSKTELRPENGENGENKPKSNQNALKKGKEKLQKLKELYEQKKADKEAVIDSLDEASTKDEALKGRLIFEKIYDNRTKQMKLLIIAVVVLSIYAICSLFIMRNLAYDAKVLPYIVRVDGNNRILSIDEAKSSNFDQMKPYYTIKLIHDFIRNARSVYVDGDLNYADMKSASAYTTGAATKVYQQYIEKLNPNALVHQKQESIDVVINNTIDGLNGVANTIQVIWTEIRRNANTGEIISQDQYTGVFSYQWMGTPKAANVSALNPIGFYITNISWSKNSN